MVAKDLIIDAGYSPTYDEIVDYMSEPAQALWQDLISFIRQEYKASPKIMYSKCSAKPGWNVKYQKSGKSLCTIYPEKDGFVVLVVITLDLVPVIQAMSGVYEKEIIDLVESARPFNGTKWLMIQVDSAKIIKNVKDLLLLKNRKQK